MVSRSSRRDAGNILFLVCLLVLIGAVVTLSLADQFLKTANRNTDTAALLGRVHEAIIGNPQRDFFGYLGDVGDYPASLEDLLMNPGGSVVGWKGPYLSNVAINGGMILDPYFSPLEFFLDATPAAEHKLAIISPGPDHGSTNGATNPNVYSQFTGVLPSNGAYAAGSENADNVGSRDFVSDANSLNFKNTGSLQLKARNDEAWNSAGIQEVCPGLYALEITSLTRGSNDKLTVPADRLTLDLLQGVWDVRVTSPAMGKPAYAGQFKILPSASVTEQVLLRPTDASQMPTGTVTISNNLASTLTMTTNDVGFSPGFTVGAGVMNSTSAAQFTCTRIEAKTGGVNGTTVYEWLQPYNVSQNVVISSAFHTLTVTNNVGGYRQIIVWVHGPTLAAANAIGNVYDRSVRSFSIMSGNTVWITDAAGAQLDTFVVSGSTSKNY